MAELTKVEKQKGASKKTEQRTIEVVLVGKHTHQGTEYRVGDKITIRKSQLKKLQEWGKVK